MTAPEILLLIGSVEGARPVREGGVPYFAQDLRPAVPGNFPIARLVTRPFECIVPLHPRPRSIEIFVSVLFCVLLDFRAGLRSKMYLARAVRCPPHLRATYVEISNYFRGRQLVRLSALQAHSSPVRSFHEFSEKHRSNVTSSEFLDKFKQSSSSPRRPMHTLRHFQLIQASCNREMLTSRLQSGIPPNALGHRHSVL